MNDGQQVVTRGVLREELARYPTREELRETLREELARYPTREELREELARYPTREELREELARFVTRDEFGQFVQLVMREHEKAEQRHGELLRLLARATTAAAEEHRRELGVLDDRYRDLPGRVASLEQGLRAHVEDAAAHGRPRRPTRKR